MPGRRRRRRLVRSGRGGVWVSRHLFLDGGAVGRLPGSQQLVKAKELQAEALKAVDRLKADDEALVGALRQVVMENRQLRQQVAEQPSNLRVLPTQPRPPGC